MCLLVNVCISIIFKQRLPKRFRHFCSAFFITTLVGGATSSLRHCLAFSSDFINWLFDMKSLYRDSPIFTYILIRTYEEDVIMVKAAFKSTFVFAVVNSPANQQMNNRRFEVLCKKGLMWTLICLMCSLFGPSYSWQITWVYSCIHKRYECCEVRYVPGIDINFPGFQINYIVLFHISTFEGNIIGISSPSKCCKIVLQRRVNFVVWEVMKNGYMGMSYERVDS